MKRMLKKRLSSALWPTAMLGLASLISGCINLPPQVKVSVDANRSVVAELHKAHAQNMRALERTTTQREQDLKYYRMAIATALRLQLEAQLEAARTKILADYDHQAGELLGIQFQKLTQQNIITRFQPVEQNAVRALVDAERQRGAFPNDPAMQTKCITKMRDLENAQCQRDNCVMTLFLVYEAEIRKARRAFETETDAACNEELQKILEQTATELFPATPVAEDLRQRFEASLSDLDAAYFSVDSSLSDISTFLDNETMTSRFVSHAVKGFGQGLFDQLMANNGAGASDIAGLFGTRGQAFGKELQQLEAQMHTKATEKVAQVKDTVNPATAVPQQTLTSDNTTTDDQ